VIKVIKDEINKINDEIDVIFVPSTDDLTNIYPIPQPKYNRSLQVEGKRMHYTSNPGVMLLHGARQNYEINLINTDLPKMNPSTRPIYPDCTITANLVT